MYLFSSLGKEDPRAGGAYQAYRLRLSRREYARSPPSLSLLGDADLLWGNRIRCAVVGSRRASAEGLARAEAVAAACAAAGHVVVSGLAVGVDGAAHRAALANGGPTVAVIPTSLEAEAWPREHAGLQAEIAARGLVVSQFESPPRPMAKGLVERNTTIALVSCAAFVPEAGERSGARHVVREALWLGRGVYFHEAVRERLRGVRWLELAIAAGAEVYGDADLAEVVDAVEGESPMK